MDEHPDAYRHIAAHYELHGCDWYARTFGGRLLQLLTERGYKGSRVLDAGCGTGTLAMMLTDAGYRVSGIDLSAAMLDVARAKDPEQRVTWTEGDVSNFDLGSECFDVITCVGDTLNHLARIEAWAATFRSFQRHPRPGGALFFDVMTPKGLEWLDTYQVTDRADRTLILGFIFEADSRRSTMKLTSFRRVEGNLYERVSDTITEWGHSASAVFSALQGAGFEAPERLWSRSEHPDEDERLTVIAERP